MNGLKKLIVKLKVNFFKKRKAKDTGSTGASRLMSLSTILIILGYFIFLLITSYVMQTPILTAVTNRRFNPNIVIGSSSLLLLAICLIIICSKGKDFITAFSIQLIEIGFIIISIYSYNNTTPISCLSISLTGLILCFVLKGHYLKLDDYTKSVSKECKSDILTGCLSSRGLEDYVQAKIRENQRFYYILIDIDNFKAISTAMGSSAGDDVLRYAAKKWSNLQSLDDYDIAHIGEDEFVIVANTASRNIAQALAEEVIDTLKGDSGTTYITASIGIVNYPFDTRDYKKIRDYAEVALRKAKGIGKGQIMFFDSQMYKEIVDRYIIEKDVNRALKSNSFVLAYQPQYDTEDHKLYGFEVLLRMKTENGLVFPKNFLDIAKSSGQIHNVDTWVINNALVEAKELLKKDPNLKIAINISSDHIANKNVVDDTINALANSEIQPAQFSIELTETSFIRHEEETIKNLNKFKLMGCGISIDNFGAEQSSLRLLTKLPIDTIKISKAFIETVDFVDETKKFIDAITTLGHSLNCTIIAEGIERQDQLAVIRDTDVDVIQGYLWGKPLELEEALSIIPD